MLSEVCREIRNWFEKKKYIGNFVISNGAITSEDAIAMGLQNGQYFRIIGSVLMMVYINIPRQHFTMKNLKVPFGHLQFQMKS